MRRVMAVDITLVGGVLTVAFDDAADDIVSLSINATGYEATGANVTSGTGVISQLVVTDAGSAKSSDLTLLQADQTLTGGLSIAASNVVISANRISTSDNIAISAESVLFATTSTIATAGNTITIDNGAASGTTVLLSAITVLDTTNGGAVTTGAAVTIRGEVTGNTIGSVLQITAGTDGDVLVTDRIGMSSGSGVPLGTVTIMGNDIELATIAGVDGNTLVQASDGTDTGSITLTGQLYATTGAFTLAAGPRDSKNVVSNPLTLTGGALGENTTIITGGSLVELSGAIDLNGRNLSIDTTAGGTVPSGGGATSGILINDAVDGAGTLTLNAGTGGTIGVNHLSGNVGSTTPLAAITLTNANEVIVKGNVNAGTVTVTDATDYVQLAGVLDLTTGLATAAQPYELRLLGGGNGASTIAGATTFLNTGNLRLGDQGDDAFTFAGGVVATAPAAVTLAGTIGATTGVITLGDADTPVISLAAAIGGASAGTITLGSVEFPDGGSLVLGTGLSNVIEVGAINGAAGAGPETVEINTVGLVTFTGTVGGGLSSLTLTNSGGTTFQSSVAVTTVSITDTTGTVAFAGALTADTLSVASGTYAVAILGDGSEIVNQVEFANTGGVTLGDGGDTITFTGGLASTAGPTTIAGVVATTDTPLSLGDVTLAANATLRAGLGQIATGAVTDGANAFELTLGSASQVGDVVLGGNVTLDALTTAAGGYGIQMAGDVNEITQAVTFANTFYVALGDDTSDVSLFRGGVSTAGLTGNTFLIGTVATAGAPITFAQTRLTGNAVLDTTNAGANPAGAEIMLSGGVQFEGFTLTTTGGTSSTNFVGPMNLTGSSIVVQSGDLNLGTGPDAPAAITFDQDATIEVLAGSLVMTANSTITAPDKAIALLADAMTFASGTGAIAVQELTLAPATAGTNIFLGSATGTGLVLPESVFDSINAATVQIGQPGFNGTVEIGSLTLARSRLDIVANGIGGRVFQSGDFVSTATDTPGNIGLLVEGSGATYVLNGSITSASDVVINDALEVSGGSWAIDTQATGANITITGGNANGSAGIYATLGETNSLNLAAGTGTIALGSVAGFGNAGGNGSLLDNVELTGGRVLFYAATNSIGGNLSVDGPAELASPANETLSFNAANVDFTSSIDSALGTTNGLVLNASRDVRLLGAVGETTPLASLTISASSITTTGATTTGPQSYTGMLTLNGTYVTTNSDIEQFVGCGTLLTGNTTLTTGSGNVTLCITTSSPANSAMLTIDSTGNTTLSSVFGLQSLEITGGTATLTGVATVGQQTYGGNVVLSGEGERVYETQNAAITINGTTELADGSIANFTTGWSNLTFGSTVDGNGTLIVNSQDFTTTAPIGDTTPLAAVTVSGTSRIRLGNNISTVGPQQYGSPGTGWPTLFMNGTFTTANDSFRQSSGCQTVLTGNVTINTGSGAIGFAITNGQTAGGEALTLITTGTTAVGTLGRSIPLASVNITGGTASLGGVHTTGPQTYGGDVILRRYSQGGTIGQYVTDNATFSVAGNTTLDSGGITAAIATGSGTIAFNGTIDGAGCLSLTSTGQTFLNGTIGGTDPLVDLTTAAGSTVSVAGDITTTGNQTFLGDLTLVSNATFTAGTPDNGSGGNGSNGSNGSNGTGTSGSILFGGSLAPVALTQTLTLNATTNITLPEIGRTTTPFSTIDTLANLTLLTGDITTIGDQHYRGRAVATQDLEIVACLGTITFGGGLDSSDANLTPDVSIQTPGNVIFSAPVGGTATGQLLHSTAWLGALNVAAGNITLAGLGSASAVSSVGATSTNLTITDTACGTLTFSGLYYAISGDARFDAAGSPFGYRFTSPTPGTAVLRSVSGDLEFVNGDIALDANVSLEAIANSGGLLLVNGDIDGVSGEDVTLYAFSDAVVLNGTIGSGGGTIGNVSISGGSGGFRLPVLLAGDIYGGLSTDNFVFISGNLALSGNRAIATSGDIFISGPIDADPTNGGALQLLTGSNVTLTHAIGESNRLSNLTITADTTSLGGPTIATSGPQTYTTNLTLADDVAIDTVNANVAFNHTIDGGHRLDISTGTGTVSFFQALGGTMPLQGLNLASAAAVEALSTIAINGTGGTGAGLRIGNGVNKVNIALPGSTISNAALSGILLAGNTTGSTFGGFTITKSGSHGIEAAGGSYTGTVFVNSSVTSSAGDGFHAANATGLTAVLLRSAANSKAGIRVAGTSSNVTISGSVVGLDANGTAAQPNLGQGIVVSAAIGTTLAGNTISGNGFYGVVVNGAAANTTISGNRIGTGTDGTTAIGNGQSGVFVLAGATGTSIVGNQIRNNNGMAGIQVVDGTSSTTIGGRAGDSNLLVGNGLFGITVSGNVPGTRILGNLVSSHTTANLYLNNAQNLTVGSTTSGEDNTFDASDYGVYAGGNLSGTTIQGNTFQQHTIGGLVLSDAGNLTVRDNTIDDNGAFGLYGTGNLAGTVIQGNSISNHTIGVQVDNGANLTIGSGRINGGTATSDPDANVITKNTSAGIVVNGAGSQNVSILSNSIFENDLIGISLSAGGNALARTPTLVTASTTQVTGSISGTNGDVFRIQYFKSADDVTTSSRSAQGQELIGYQDVTIAGGTASIDFDLTGSGVIVTDWITATATLLVGGLPSETSQFSFGIRVTV
jgi:parallel beta-helix repeat protein